MSNLTEQGKRWLAEQQNTAMWTVIAILSVAWWIAVGQRSMQRFVLIAGVSIASFMVGSLIGFLFTSYGEESGTVGKVRDWLIGAITGLTLAKVGAIKQALDLFTQQDGPSFALVLSNAVTYVCLGFFFMFLQRELILNVLLAERRSERGKFEGSQTAGHIIQQFQLKLPASVLSGVSDIAELLQVKKPEADKLKGLIYSDEVNKFLSDAESITQVSGSLNWDVVSKVAYIHYYRTYFEDQATKAAEVQKALEWITRALTMNPMHADLTLKLSDMQGADADYASAIETLKRLETRPEAPFLVKQWLGYFLLFIPDREEEAMAYSEQYLSVFPDDADAVFNIACGYAQLYYRELQIAGADRDESSESRAAALQYLRKALRNEPDYAAVVRTKWTGKGESFEALANDPEFLALVNPPAAKPATA